MTGLQLAATQLRGLLDDLAAQRERLAELVSSQSADPATLHAVLTEISARIEQTEAQLRANGNGHSHGAEPHPAITSMTAIADAAVELSALSSPADRFDVIAQQAQAAVIGCDSVSITLVRSYNHVQTPTATSDVAAQCDQMQYNEGEGPCLTAIEDNKIVRVDDMGTELRWPGYAPKAAALGVGSMLAVPLVTPRGLMGALNLYAMSANAFDTDAELVCVAYATHAAIAIAHAELESNLRLGLTTREEIGQAVGILMERHRVNATTAFDMLVYASQRTHRKLREIAAWVNETGQDPSVLLESKDAPD
jgi:transcriptional regulator with GAF, ATPase, and Fis domain